MISLFAWDDTFLVLESESDLRPVWAKVIKQINVFFNKNIARGTTDPEIDSVTWIELGNN